jgi:hypothetical protein
VPNNKAILRLARDDETTVDEDTMEKLITYLKSRLKPEEISHLQMILKGEPAEDGQVDSMPTEKDKTMASDSRGNRYADRFPDAVRIVKGY